MTTYAEHQERESSQKTGLAILEATRRLVGWAVYSGSVYRLALTEQVLVSVSQAGTALTAAASIAAITAGKYYHDRQGGYLYLQASGSVSPDSVFITLLYRFFFANVPTIAPHDLSTGFDVEWLHLLDEDSRFVVEIENTKNLLGVAISNSSSIRLKRDPEFWDSLYDKVTFESQRVLLYSWSASLPITEAKLVYKGRIEKKKFEEKFITFELKDFLDELRSPVQLTSMNSYVGAKIPDNLRSAFQRRLYGYVQGLVPTPIDQYTPTLGWLITGTVTISAGGTALSGSSTAFLSELSPGDDLFIGTALRRVRIDSIAGDDSATLSEAFSEAAQTAVTAYVIPSHAKRYMNRRFLVAGHALARPQVTVTEIIDNASFYVNSTDELLEGDTVEFGGEQTTIRVLGDGFVKLTDALGSGLAVSSTVYRSAVHNVYLDGYLLELTRDYTYDAATALITLTSTAEFNVAPTRILSGTIVITNPSRNVVGTGTQFRDELAPGMWIKGPTTGTWYEVLEVVDDTNAILRSTPSSETGATLFKRPVVYEQGRSVLACDCLGKKDASGNFIRYPGAVAKDLLIDAGLSADIVAASFTTVDEILPHRLGLSLPAKFNDRKTPYLRDVLNGVCRSVFASIVLNNEWQLEMSPLEPSYSDAPTELNEPDVTRMDVDSDSTQLIAAANVNYNLKEYDAASAGTLARVKTETNPLYLYTTEKEHTLDTYLVDEEDAEIMASRWVLLLSRANSDIRVSTKLKAARFKVFDVVKLNHEKLYERFGSTERMRIGAVVSVKKTVTGTEILINDVGNTYTRCARIASSAALDYDQADEADKLLNGYMTDENGLTDGVEGLNLIW